MTIAIANEEEKVEIGIKSFLDLSHAPRARKLEILRRVALQVTGELEDQADLATAEAALALSSSLSSDPVEAEGGTVSAEEFGKLIGGLSRVTINEYRKRKTILALPRGNVYRYPLFQVRDGGILQGIRESIAVLESEGVESPRAQALLLLSHLHSRNGPSHRPIDLLRAGKTEQVLDLLKINAKR